MTKPAIKTAQVSDTRIDSLDDEATAAVESAAPTDAEEVHVVGAIDDQMSGKRVKVMMHASQGDGGSDAVFASINGYAYQIPRGKPVSIPVELMEVLKNAIQTNYSTGALGSNVAQEIPRFAFNTL